MRRNTLAARFPSLAVACLTAALVLASFPVHAAEPQSDSPANKLIVHEWGTFTSFSGSDGVNLEYRPLETSDLPRFVVSPLRKPGKFDLMLKEMIVGQQRMETPVTYFYTDRPRVVRASVEFPKGMLTEWYPVVSRHILGNGNTPETQDRVVGGAFLDWGKVRLTPPDQFADIRVRGSNNTSRPAWLPGVAANDHYGRARETDSAIVEAFDAEGQSYFEKFLFYRGLGNYDLPVKLVALGNDRFQIANSADEPTGALFLVRIDDDRVRFTKIEPLSANTSVDAKLPATASTVDQLAEAMAHDLTAAGLYEKEAWAMVNTWRSSWFGEKGTRLLYLVPQKFTDELLPLTISPAPEECVRVMVGRLETLTPEDCQRLDVAIMRDGAPELESLGRFAEPALAYLISQSTDARQRSKLEKALADIRSRN